MKKYKQKRFRPKGVILCSEQEIEQIIKLYKNGHSSKELSVKFPISPKTIKRLLLSRGIVPRNIKQASLKKEKHPKWKNGRFTNKKGYVFIYSPNHPFARKIGGSLYVPEHRLIMEKHLKRYLTKDEVVHHKDGNPRNNKLSNLKLFTKWAHISHHSSLLKLKRDNQGNFLNKNGINNKNKKRIRNNLGRFEWREI